MPDLGWAALRQALIHGYADILGRLTLRLGSKELAQDALHDTFVRIERGGALGTVRKPQAFLMRMALNTASNQRRSDSRLIPSSEGRILLDAIDQAPGPEEVAADRSDIARLQLALAELPPRRRAIFIAAWGEGVSRQELADRFGIALRTVKYEITLARQHCAERLGRSAPNLLPFSARELSEEGGEAGSAGQAAPDGKTS